MNLPLFIARRMSGASKQEQSAPWRMMRRIAIVSVAVSVAVMIIALGIVRGFADELTAKVRGFAEDVTITLRTEGNVRLNEPFALTQLQINGIKKVPGVESIARYSTANGLMQTDDNVEGVIFKGIGSDYDHSFLEQHIVEGALPHYVDSVRSREVVISRALANRMNVGVGDVFKFIVVNENPRRDRFRVAAIYQSGLDEFDLKFIFADIATVNRINGWQQDFAEGYQIRTDGTNELAEAVFDALPNGRWNVDTSMESYSQFFDWIKMMQMNTSFVMAIMIIVAAVNMLCGVLIIILESVRMVGILRTQGISGWKLQQIFTYRCAWIVVGGLFWGNLIGVGLCLVQQHFSVITLNAQAYLLKAVPVSVTFADLAMVNVGSFMVILLLMTLPTMIVARIEPSQSLKFD